MPCCALRCFRGEASARVGLLVELRMSALMLASALVSLSVDDAGLGFLFIPQAFIDAD